MRSRTTRSPALIRLRAKFYIIGGTGAVNASVENALKGYGETARVWGSTRYEISANVTGEFFDNPEAAVLAYGENFPDGLDGGSLANSKGIKTGAVLGGPTLINDTKTKKIFGISESAGIIVR